MWSAFCISTPLVSIRRILRSVASVVQGCFHPKTIIYERARVTRREAGTTQGFRENMGSSHLSSSAQIYAPENRSVCPFHASSQDLHAYSQGQKRPLKRRPRVTFSPTSMSLQHSMAFPQYFLLVVLSWIYVSFRFLRKKSTIPLPPGPPADPLLGHLRCLMHATNTTFFEWHRQYGIPYFSLPSHTVR